MVNGGMFQLEEKLTADRDIQLARNDYALDLKYFLEVWMSQILIRILIQILT